MDNNDYIITEEQIDNVENPAINSFLLMNNNEDQNEHSESNESVKAIKVYILFAQFYNFRIVLVLSNIL